MKTYGGTETLVRAVDGIDLEIAEGEFMVIVGPSGSGKSTLLQLLGRSDRPSAGTISFEDRDLGSSADVELADASAANAGLHLPAVQPDSDALRRSRTSRWRWRRRKLERRRSPAPRPRAPRAGRARPASRSPALAALRRRAAAGGHRKGARQRARRAARRRADRQPRHQRRGEAILALLYWLWEETGITVVLITHDQAIAKTAPRVLAMADGHIASQDAPDAKSLFEARAEAAR